ncbi:hydroxymethylglutaryl-CoA lyase [Granulicella sp. L46]|uniref:hydroxymethylglutaryl-CoA lyase n=1 Tax=Granulicella sp. L46 TaxID=1641865 RepID=UPI00131E2E57|nr:hydroxymethylglutaryl-CoA lyase [Granulicella sp. L46]
MADGVKIVECPRDAWQALPGHIPAERKAAYLRQLVDAGFRHIDAVSFVSPGAVPQMADSEEVLRLLGPVPGVDVIGIVVNEKGAERAIATEAVGVLGFPYSISPTFLERNQRQTPKESLQTLEAIQKMARPAGVRVVAYVSMAFGNPYGDDWSLARVTEACKTLEGMGIETVSLADTVGAATSLEVLEVVGEVVAEHKKLEVGVHLHVRRDFAVDRVKSAYAGGCRRFDAAIGGLGGCPFAQDELVGNLPTDELLEALRELGLGAARLQGLNELEWESARIARDFGGRAV